MRFIGACNFGKRCFLYWWTVGVSLLWINNIMLCVNRQNPKSLHLEPLKSDWNMRPFNWVSSAEQSIRCIPRRKRDPLSKLNYQQASSGEKVLGEPSRLLRMGILTWCKKVIFSTSGLNALFCRHPAYLYFRFSVGTMKMALAYIWEGSDIIRDVA